MEKTQYGDDRVEAAPSPTFDGKDSPTEADQIVNSFTVEDTRKLLRRVDLRLIPICGAMYCVSLLDSE